MELSLVGEFADLNARISMMLRQLYEKGVFKDIEKEFDDVCRNLPERYTLALDFDLKLCDSKGRHPPLRLSNNGIECRGKSAADTTRLTTLPQAAAAAGPQPSSCTETVVTEIIGRYTVIRITQEGIEHAQLNKIAESVRQLFKSGRKDIALSFAPDCYPYSRVLALLAQCQKTAEEYGRKIVAVSESTVFSDILRHTQLDDLVKLVASEKELK